MLRRLSERAARVHPPWASLCVMLALVGVALFLAIGLRQRRASPPDERLAVFRGHSAATVSSRADWRESRQGRVLVRRDKTRIRPSPVRSKPVALGRRRSSPSRSAV